MTRFRARVIVIVTSFAFGTASDSNLYCSVGSLTSIRDAAIHDTMVQMGLHQRCMLAPDESGFYKKKEIAN